MTGIWKKTPARWWTGSSLLRDIDDDLDVGDREVAGLTVDASLEPVLIDAAREIDDVTFSEAQFALILRLKVVQRLATGLIP